MGEKRGRPRTTLRALRVRGPVQLDASFTQQGAARAPKQECLLTLFQLEDAPPVVTEHANTIGGPVVATREAVGFYRLTFPGSPFSKPVIVMATGRSPFEQVFASRSGSDSILVETWEAGAHADNVMADTPLLILVFT